MTLPFSHFGDISIQQFLDEYWQKKPLLIKNAFPDFESPLDGNEIAGLALDDDVVSRLVIEDAQSNDWSVEHGPLEETRFSTLPQTHWSLLVQHADLLDPQVNLLLNAFRFIPNWRLDDIMVSYASDQGSVGPHFDYYDVFLLQGDGERVWRTGQHCDAQTPLVSGQPIRVLKSMSIENEWTLKAGDMLYIPPNIAHHGVAVGESITYSIGFRAPSHSEMLLEHAQELVSSLSEDQRYQDKDLRVQEHPGEIKPEVFDSVQASLQALVDNRECLEDWFSKLVSRPHQTEETDEVLDEFDDLERGDYLHLNRMSRCVFIGHIGEHRDTATCFIDGERFETTLYFARKLSSYEFIDLANLCREERIMAKSLYASGKFQLVANYHDES